MCSNPYPEMVSKETGKITPEFQEWLEYVLSKIDSHEEVIIERILEHKDFSILSNEDNKIFREVLSIHATKTNCSACYGYFRTWEQQSARIRIGKHVALHKECENRYKLKLLKEKQPWKSLKTCAFAKKSS